MGGIGHGSNYAVKEATNLSKNIIYIVTMSLYSKRGPTQCDGLSCCNPVT
jgi:hypothetical protein